MSALGQKRTFAVQKGMSALPPLADILRCEKFLTPATPKGTMGRLPGSFRALLEGATSSRDDATRSDKCIICCPPRSALR